MVMCVSRNRAFSFRWRSMRASTSSSRSGTAVSPSLEGGLSVGPGCGLRKPAEVVVRRTGALGGHHAGADRGLGRTRRAEHLALVGLDDALQDLAALAGLRV